MFKALAFAAVVAFSSPALASQSITTTSVTVTTTGSENVDSFQNHLLDGYYNLYLNVVSDSGAFSSFAAFLINGAGNAVQSLSLTTTGSSSSGSVSTGPFNVSNGIYTLRLFGASFNGSSTATAHYTAVPGPVAGAGLIPFLVAGAGLFVARKRKQQWLAAQA